MKHNSREAFARIHALPRRNNVFSFRKKPNRPELQASASSVLARYSSVADMIEQLRPQMPVYCIRPHSLSHSAQQFLQSFPGQVLFAVKTNPDPVVLRYLHQAGITHFDAASIAEVAAAYHINPAARIYFMHPVKSREAIRSAYYDYGVRDFSLDSMQELQKILHETHQAEDLRLYVRLAIENSDAAYSLSGKFGVTLSEARQQHFVSIPGRATVQHDADRKRDLWSIAAQAWFPDGPESDDIVLLCVDIEEAEFWDGEPNPIVLGVKLAKAVAEGERMGGGGSQKLSFRSLGESIWAA